MTTDLTSDDEKTASIPSDLDALFDKNLRRRKQISALFEKVCFFSTWIGIMALIVLIASVVWDGWDFLTVHFLTNFSSTITPEDSGLFGGIIGSFWLILLTALFSIPIGMGAAIYLEEFAYDNWLTKFIQLNISNLAGVPSVVYGVLGLTIFARMFSVFDSQIRAIPLGFATIRIPLPLGDALITGAMTLSLLILPIIIIACQESLRSVPPSIRHGAYALGATKWRAVRDQVFPAALPGMMTGVILAISRAIGETAPLVIVGAAAFLGFPPGDINRPSDIVTNPQGFINIPFGKYEAMPITIYGWAQESKPVFTDLASAGIVVLLAILLLMNAIAVYIRHRSSKKLRH